MNDKKKLLDFVLKIYADGWNGKETLGPTITLEMAQAGIRAMMETWVKNIMEKE